MKLDITCKSEIKKILWDNQKKFLEQLCDLVKTEHEPTDYIGETEDYCINCKYILGFGSHYYCTNGKLILKFKDENPTEFENVLYLNNK